jgi:hypothetical protein
VLSSSVYVHVSEKSCANLMITSLSTNMCSRWTNSLLKEFPLTDPLA